MAFYPKDMLDEPYEFGECKERMVEATVTCECFKNDSVKVWVTVRKRGDWVEVSVPNIFEESKEDTYYDESTFKIESFLDGEELGKNPRKRIFWCLTRTFEVDTFVPKTVPAMVTLEKDGTMLINPANKYEKVDKDRTKTTSVINYFFLAVGCSGYIATYGFTFASDLNDSYTFYIDIKLKKISMKVESNWFILS